MGVSLVRGVAALTVALCCTSCEPPLSCFEGQPGCRVTYSLCGNGYVDFAQSEICDVNGPQLNGRSCQNFGFAGGALACAPDCREFVLDACTSAAPCDGTAGMTGALSCAH